MATPSIQVRATAAAPVYADLDNDRIEDATFSLAPGLTAAEVASGAAITARWTAAGQGYEADILPGGVTGVGDPDLPMAFEIGASPNPSRSGAFIHYALPREGRVRIRVFLPTTSVSRGRRLGRSRRSSCSSSCSNEVQRTRAK